MTTLPSQHLPKIDDAVYQPFLDHGFERRRVSIPPPAHDPSLELSIHTLVYPAEKSQQTSFDKTLVLLHGHPQSAVIWHRVIPALFAKLSQKQRHRLQIIIPDLRGHGMSTAPAIERDDQGNYKSDVMRGRYSKREMARDVVEVVKALGGAEPVSIVGHDRGGRVAHRLALDRPDFVKELITLDIAPTYDMYEQTDYTFATAYWHWFFLIQPHPFPEEIILAKPSAYLQKMTSRFPNSSQAEQPKEPLHPPQTLASYEATLSSPAHVEATCEDYRQAAPGGMDWELDAAARKAGHKIQCPLRALWGDRGIIQQMYGRKTLDLWQAQTASELHSKSRAVDSGHYVPEDAPHVVANDIVDFFDLMVLT